MKKELQIEEKKLQLEREEFKESKNPTFLKLLQDTVLQYCHSNANPNKEEVRNLIRDNFIIQCNEAILARVENLPNVKNVLIQKIYKRSLRTLVDRISNEIYRMYIEEKEEKVEVNISKKTLNALDISQATFIKKSKILAPLFENFIKIHTEKVGMDILLNLSLII